MTEAPPPPPATEERPKMVAELLGRKRIAVFAVVLAAELLIFFAAMLVPMTSAQQQELVNTANNLLGSASSQGPLAVFLAILANNVRVALIEMIPVAGAALFVVSIFTTGQVIQALAISNNLPGPLFGLLLFFFPFSIVELSAYAIAVASGLMLIVAWRGRRLVSELKIFVLECAVVVIALVLAAAMETVGIVEPIVGFALWLPTALGLFALFMAVRGAWR